MEEKQNQEGEQPAPKNETDLRFLELNKRWT